MISALKEEFVLAVFKRYVSRELVRCQRNLDRGGSPRFWIWRLRPVLAMLDELAATVRQRMAGLEVELELERGAREASVALKAGEDA